MPTLARRFVEILIVGSLALTTHQPAEAAAATTPSPRVAATQAIGAGDGAKAARIIRNSSLATRPAALGRIIYDAGVIAVKADRGDAFSRAVAAAFTRGGVTFARANLAFKSAATLVVTNAPHDEQLLGELGPGGAAVLRTELAYLGLSLPPLGFL